MTRKQAIDLLDNLIGFIEDSHGSDYDEALKLAIKALEQEPSEDCISRQVAIDTIRSMFAPTPTQKDMVEDCLEIIENLPSAQQEPKTGLNDTEKQQPPVTPQQSWIPVSERLPEKNVEVLATTEWGAVTIAEMYNANDWFIHEGTTNACTDEIMAWMPLPEPYKAESEEK